MIVRLYLKEITHFLSRVGGLRERESFTAAISVSSSQSVLRSALTYRGFFFFFLFLYSFNKNFPTKDLSLSSLLPFSLR